VNIYWIAFVWIAMALAASMISIRIGISVVLVEILVGAVVGNLPHASAYVQQTDFTNFLASLGSVMLTFLAGAEIDPVSLRKHWRASLGIGLVSFLLPFLGAFAIGYWALGWDVNAALIGGIALSTTSVAVVYAVMVETGLNRQEIGKLILAACFVTDLGTVLALGGFFANFGALLIVFMAVSIAVLALLPATMRFVISGIDVRLHCRTVRSHPRPDRPAAVLGAGDGGAPVRVHSDPHRAAVLPAEGGGRGGGRGPGCRGCDGLRPEVALGPLTPGRSDVRNGP
jgi:Kef-type K+ transport system membrane component KefB